MEHNEKFYVYALHSLRGVSILKHWSRVRVVENKPGRSFRTEFGVTHNDFSIVLYERTSMQNYEYCFASGLFNDLGTPATVIDLVVNKLAK